MEQKMKSLSDLVKANPNKIVRGRFTSFMGPYVSNGGWYDIIVEAEGDKFKGNVYSYASDINADLSGITGKLVFRAFTHEPFDSPGLGWEPYSDEEFVKRHGYEREDVAKVLGYVDKMTKETSREFEGDVLVIPYFKWYRGEIPHEAIAKAEREILGFDSQEICRLKLTDEAEFERMLKMNYKQLEEQFI